MSSINQHKNIKKKPLLKLNKRIELCKKLTRKDKRIKVQSFDKLIKSSKIKPISKAFLIEDYEILKNIYPMFDKYTSNKKFNSVQGLFAIHPFFKFMSFARDNGKEVLAYYRSLSFDEKKDYEYTIEELIEMEKDYIKFKTNEKIRITIATTSAVLKTNIFLSFIAFLISLAFSLITK